MTVQDFAVQTVTSIFSGLGGAGLLVWIFRTWVSEKLKNSIRAEFDMKLESYKTQIKAAADVELEQLRSRLAIQAKEHDVVFSKLHERRSEIIADIYAKLKRVQLCLGEYTAAFELAGEKPRDERGQDFFDAYKEFFDVFNNNAIFLPANPAKSIEELNKVMLRSGNEFTYFVRNERYPRWHEKWTEIEEHCQNAIPTIIAELEVTFRKLLGYRGDELGD